MQGAVVTKLFNKSNGPFLHARTRAEGALAQDSEQRGPPLFARGRVDGAADHEPWGPPLFTRGRDDGGLKKLLVAASLDKKLRVFQMATATSANAPNCESQQDNVPMCTLVADTRSSLEPVECYSLWLLRLNSRPRSFRCCLALFGFSGNGQTGCGMW